MESRPEPDQQTSEAHLRARLKFQRFLFGSLALVLLTMWALGLGWYRDLSEGHQEAQEQSRRDRHRAALAESDTRRVQADLKQKEREETERSGSLGLAYAQLAMLELRSTAPAARRRARALANEAVRYGPPPWLPLLRWALREARPLEFKSREHNGLPVSRGAAARDGSAVVIARGRTALEVYDTARAELRLSIPLTGRDPVTALALSSRGEVFAGFESGRLRLYSPIEDGFRVTVILEASEDSAVAGLAFDPSESRLCGTGRGVISLERSPSDKSRWRRARPPDAATWTPPPARALAAAIVSAESGDYAYILERELRLRSNGQTLHTFTAAPERAAVARVADYIYAASVTGNTLELVAVTVRGGAVGVIRVELPFSNPAHLGFEQDGTLRIGGPGGQNVLASLDGILSLPALGDSEVRFIASDARGTIFGTARGVLNLRPEGSQLRGRAVARIEQGFSATAAAGGFVLSDPSGTRSVWNAAAGRWRLAGAYPYVFATRQGFAASNGRDLLLPVRVNQAGPLLGVCNGDSLFLLGGDERLTLRRMDGATLYVDRLGSGLPDAVATACEADVAAVKFRDALWVVDFSGGRTTRLSATGDLAAVDAQGRKVAVATGATVDFYDSRGGAKDPQVVLRTRPGTLALLFRGTVLVTAESGALVLYEVASGRELLRQPGTVRRLAAGANDQLLLVLENEMRIIQFSEKTSSEG